jgi:hypothetical protein
VDRQFPFSKEDSFPESNVGGSFACQECNEKVKGAYYDRMESALLWRCSKNHISVIEEFSL